MKRLMVFGALLIAGLVVFLPKTYLYYTAEEALSSARLHLVGETIEERVVYLDVRDATVLLNAMPIGSVERIRLMPLIVYNRATVSSVAFAGEFAPLFPEGIERLDFTYTVLNPTKVTIEGVGGFGPVRGEIDLMEGKMTLVFEPSPVLRLYPLLLAKLHTSEKGLVYETSF